MVTSVARFGRWVGPGVVDLFDHVDERDPPATRRPDTLDCETVVRLAELLPGRCIEGVISAALYIATQQANCPRTLAEVADRVSGEIGPGTHPDSEVYVDPGTGQILRVERQPINNKLNNSLEVSEFYAHGEPETADIELLKERSVHETGDDLDSLPWE